MVTAYKLVIEYDGTGYNGWQIQNEVPTVQGEMEKVLLRLTGQHLRIAASGRTDAGVHALGQVAGFTADLTLSIQELHHGLNSLLPDDIVVHTLEEVPKTFHPRYDVLSKVYQYRILNRQLPNAIGRHYYWHLRRPLDLGAMQLAADYLKGTHDFTTFEGAGSPRASSVRQVMKAELSNQEQGVLAFDIEANGFLRFMVRNIVGTLVEVGLAKRSPESVKQILEAKDRRLAGATAPPQGLFLLRVNY